MWELLGTVGCEQQIIVSGFFFLLSESRIQDVDNDWVGFICIPSFRVLAEHDCFLLQWAQNLKYLNGYTSGSLICVGSVHQDS